MVVGIGVLLPNILVQKVGRIKVVDVVLATFHNQSRLFIADRTTLCCYWCQAGRGHFVNIASRLGAAEIQRVTVLVIEEAQCESISLLGKLVGVSLWSDHTPADILVPEHTHATPTGRHSVERVERPGGDKHPVVADQFENVVGDIGDFDLLEFFVHFISVVFVARLVSSS